MPGFEAPKPIGGDCPWPEPWGGGADPAAGGELGRDGIGTFASGVSGGGVERKVSL